jgi:cell division protein FtsB
VTLGVIGYLLVLLFESAGRPAALETQNRQLAQEVQALQAELKKLQKKP